MTILKHEFIAIFLLYFQEVDFRRLCYFLQKVNYSVWFGKGLFHTNIVEDLWSKKNGYPMIFQGLILMF